MTDPPMYNVANAVFCRSLAIVRSLPLPGCDKTISVIGSKNSEMESDVFDNYNRHFLG